MSNPETYNPKRELSMQIDVLKRLDTIIAIQNGLPVPGEDYRPVRLGDYNLSVLWRLDAIIANIGGGGGGAVETVNNIGVDPGTKNISLLAENIPCLFATDPSNVQIAINNLTYGLEAFYSQMTNGERTDIQDFHHYDDNGIVNLDIYSEQLFTALQLDGNNCRLYLNSGNDVYLTCSNIDAFVQTNKLFRLLIYNTGVGERLIDLSNLQGMGTYVFLDQNNGYVSNLFLKDYQTAEITFERVANRNRVQDEVIIKYFGQS